jgi:hypothetical protein
LPDGNQVVLDDAPVQGLRVGAGPSRWASNTSGALAKPAKTPPTWSGGAPPAVRHLRPAGDRFPPRAQVVPAPGLDVDPDHLDPGLGMRDLHLGRAGGGVVALPDGSASPEVCGAPTATVAGRTQAIGDAL